MSALAQVVALLVDDWRVRWHRRRCDHHAAALAAAVEQRCARILRWTGRP